MPTPDDYNNNQPGYRNFNPPPTTPDTFTRSNDRGSTQQHPVDPSNYNSPTTTQTAQAPPPPGVPVGTTYPPPPENVPPPSPTPAEAKPEPAAKPLPNLGAWTPDQAAPWMHVRPIPPQAVPDRPPDTHVGTRPAWHPRPGEAGYGQGPRQPGNYTFGENLGLALQAGFTGPAAYTAAAIGMAESNGNPNSIHYQDGGKPWNSYGLMQINGSNDQTLRAAGINGAAAAVDPLTSYKAAFILSKGGTDFSPWSTFTHGDYKAYLDGNARPEASSTLVAGPRQEYRPPPGRESADWGRTPEHDWSPGNMPTAHDIPSIMGGLLPMALTLFAGLAGGQGALGAITFFSAYQTARNKGQLEAAKEARTQWRDKLAETEAGLKEELLESSGLMAQYGNDFNSPAARAAWQGLASKYQDTQLQAAIESGNSAAVQELFKKRDEAFQTLSKTSAAATKAEEQETQREKDQADERAMGFPGTTGGGGGTGAPAGPEKPWENLGPGFSGGGAPTPQVAPPPGGGPAGVTAPGGGTTSPPAAAPPPSSEESPSPEEPPPPAPAAAPAPPGTPSETLPPVSVTAPAPTPPQQTSAPRTPFDAMVSDIVNGEEIEKLKPAIPADGLRKIQAAAADKETQIEAVRPGPHAAEQLKAIDPTFGYYAEGVSNYTMPDPTARSQNRGYIARLFAAAQKINPYWDYKDYATKQEFRTSFNPDKDVGKTLSRTSRLMNLTKELADDAAHLPNTNVASFNNLIAWFQGKEVGDPRYTKFIADWRLFANDAQAVASGKGIPPVTLTSHLIDTLQMGATPQMIRQGIKEDLLAALSSVDPSVAGWHGQFPGQANPPMFDQGTYAQLNQYAHMNIETGAVPEALPDVGTSQQWGGQTHYYLGGDITNKLNWSTVKPPGTQ